MPVTAVDVKGLAQFQRELRLLDKALPRELTKAHKTVAEFIVSRTRTGNLSPQQRRALPGVVAAAQQRHALVRFDPNKRPFVLGAFFGSRRYRQFPEWVGNRWEPGGPGGPYVVNQQIRQHDDDIIDLYGDLFDRLAKLAFPD